MRIDFPLVRALRKAQGRSERPGERELIFATDRGTPLDYGNLHRRVLKPAAEEAGVPWAAFHTLRHTCASRLFAHARNAVQMQRSLGHHSPAFTLSVYVHLMGDDLEGPLTAPLTCSKGVGRTDRRSSQVPQAERADEASRWTGRHGAQAAA